MKDWENVFFVFEVAFIKILGSIKNVIKCDIVKLIYKLVKK